MRKMYKNINAPYTLAKDNEKETLQIQGMDLWVVLARDDRTLQEVKRETTQYKNITSKE